MAYCAACDPEHSPSRGKVEIEPLTLMTINSIKQIREQIFQEFCSYSKARISTSDCF
jgi:hypothetical protein